MHKVFISYHHTNDQYYKERLLYLNILRPTFIDASVDTGGISDDLPDQTIRQKIRDEYLRDSTVTILLVGTETKYRKHIDWEIYSSMYDGMVNKKSGIIVITLPSINCHSCETNHVGEKEALHPDITNWSILKHRSEYEERYPYLPARIIDNLKKSDVKISVVHWDKIENNFEALSFLIDATYRARANCNYDLTRQMRRANS